MTIEPTIKTVTATVVIVLRWVLVLPLAAVAVLLIDGLVVTLLTRAGVADQTTPWLLGKITGHLAMGVAAVVTGVWLAPVHKALTAWVLLALIVVISVVSLFTSGLRLPLIGPLAAAFVVGAVLPALGYRPGQPR